MASKWEKLSPNVERREDGVLRIKNVRLSYPHLFEPYKGDNADKDAVPKYGTKALMDKKTHKEDAVALRKLAMEMAVTEFKQKIPADKMFIRDGSAFGKDELEQSCFILSANEKIKPTLRDASGKREVKEEDDMLYAGCVATLLIKPWTQNNKFGKRVNAGLVAVQWTGEGERIGTGRPAVDDDDFDSVSEDFDGDYDDDDGFGDEDDDGFDD